MLVVPFFCLSFLPKANIIIIILKFGVLKKKTFKKPLSKNICQKNN
jgi:hypothetical protein